VQPSCQFQVFQSFCSGDRIRHETDRWIDGCTVQCCLLKRDSCIKTTLLLPSYQSLNYSDIDENVWHRTTLVMSLSPATDAHKTQNTNFNSNDDKQGTVQKTGWKWSVRSVSGTNITNDNDDEDKHEDDWHQCCIASAAFWLCFSSSALLHHHTYTTIVIIIIIYTTFTDSSCPSPSAAPLITRSQKPSIVG